MRGRPAVSSSRGSRMKIGMSWDAFEAACVSAVLSKTRRSLRNQWMAHEASGLASIEFVGKIVPVEYSHGAIESSD